MASISYQFGRRKIFFSDHALDRWWERCEANNIKGRQAAIDLLKERLKDAKWTRDVPPWSKLSVFHRARVEGVIYLDASTCFIINKNPNGDLVAVTYLERL
jgi:hypothetical protein